MSKDTCSAGKVNTCPAGSASIEAGPAASPLLHLYSNNGIEGTPSDGQEKAEAIFNLCNVLTPYHKRQAHTLFSNVQRLVTKEAPTVGHVGFFTITTPDSVTDSREFRKRFHSFTTNFLKKHPAFGPWVATKEVQVLRGIKEGNTGSWHTHLVVVLAQDIRDGFNFEEMAKGNYRSASPWLRNLWKELREALPKYKLGRSELVPIKSGPDAIARYVGKYISKHVGCRTEEQKGVRLISYSGSWIRNSCRIAWNSKNASEWRRKVALFAERAGCSEYWMLAPKLGQDWAYRFAQDIMDIDKTIMEEKINANSEGREITRTQYKDPTITRAKDRKAVREKKLMKKLEIHTKRPVNLEEKRKLEVAKQGAKKWVQGQVGKAITEEKETSGWTTVINGKLVIRTGKRAGEELF